MTDTIDWDDLLIDVICRRIEEGDPAAAAYLRERIEAAFVPVERYNHFATLAEARYHAGREATARAEAAEARVKALEEALRECRDQLWHLAKDPASNPWIKQADDALGGEKP